MSRDTRDLRRIIKLLEENQKLLKYLIRELKPARTFNQGTGVTFVPGVPLKAG